MFELSKGLSNYIQRNMPSHYFAFIVMLLILKDSNCFCLSLCKTYWFNKMHSYSKNVIKHVDDCHKT